jgi:Phosphomevalonate kinase
MIIGLSGKKRAGKDTVAEIMRCIFKDKSIRLAFADELKHEVARACNVTVAEIEFNKAMFRPVLQWWGSEFKRDKFGDDYWINIMSKKIAYLSDRFNPIIISDVRFKNEFDMVKSLGGVMIRVERPALPVVDNHISETALDNETFDIVVTNDSSIDNLVETLVTKLKQNKLI